MIRIAVVEDEDTYAEVLLDYIRRFADETKEPLAAERFCDGMSFLEDYRGAFDIVLLDIAMPHMNGLEAARRTSVGRVYSMNTVRIAEDGEILVRSPAMAQGAAGEDGFWHTGDLGYIDEEGYLRVSGRKKDIIIRNGNNLSALAIEQKLLQMPQVLDACVVGVNDEKEGEVPAAAVVLHAGCRAEDLPFAENMIKPEMPKYWKALAAIPLTATGKPDKQAVRAFFAGDGR